MNANTTTKAKATTTQKLLTAVLCMQVLTLLGLWTGQPRAATAHAAIPDPGAQREAQVEQQRKTNEKLDRLIELLSSGKLKVQVESAEK
jgi:hypothetical protein